MLPKLHEFLIPAPLCAWLLFVLLNCLCRDSHRHQTNLNSRSKPRTHYYTNRLSSWARCCEGHRYTSGNKLDVKLFFYQCFYFSSSLYACEVGLRSVAEKVIDEKTTFFGSAVININFLKHFWLEIFILSWSVIYFFLLLLVKVNKLTFRWQSTIYWLSVRLWGRQGTNFKWMNIYHFNEY